MELYQKLAVATVGVTLSFGMIEANIASPATAATLKYQIIDLGSTPDFTYPVGINDLGQVVGTSLLSDGTPYAFRTQPNQPINQATDNLGASGYDASFGVLATRINNQGQIIGRANTDAFTTNAFLTQPNQPINKATDDLGSLGGSITDANAINNLGQVAGDSFTTGNNSVFAIRTEPGQSITPTDNLSTLDQLKPSPLSTSIAYGINDLGQVVGFSSVVGSNNTRAFRTAANQPINPKTDDLGTLGGSTSEARDINNLGQVVGDSMTAKGDTHAFLSSVNQPINPKTDDLGTLGGNTSVAYRINNSGVVVGYSTLTGNSIFHAFVNDGSLQDLNSLAISLGDFSYLDIAYDINSLGQIVGTGVLSSTGTEDVFLAIPINEHPQPVPEPSDSIISTLAVLSLSLFVRRKGKV